MENFMETVKQKFNQSFANDIAEQDMLESLLAMSGEYRMELLKWVMKDKKFGFVAARRQAGLEFVMNEPDEGWKILEQLILSQDPDDRDTAFEILVELNDPRSPNLVKNLLNDEYPYLQFEACDFLLNIFPKDVRITLQKLTSHKNVIVREAAEKILYKLDRRENS
jgi:HEAT repeat protein